jgi:hypothetical protein
VQSVKAKGGGSFLAGADRFLLPFSSLSLPAAVEMEYGVNAVFWQEKLGILQLNRVDND